MLIRLALRAESALLCHRVKAGFLTEQENVYCFLLFLCLTMSVVWTWLERLEIWSERQYWEMVYVKKKKITTPNHPLNKQPICVEKMNLAKPLGFVSRGTASGNGCQKGRLDQQKGAFLNLWNCLKWWQELKGCSFGRPSSLLGLSTL